MSGTVYMYYVVLTHTHTLFTPHKKIKYLVERKRWKLVRGTKNVGVGVLLRQEEGSCKPK